MAKTFTTLGEPRRFEARVKGSRFLAFAWPVSGEAEARSHLAALRQDHPDATHHCWALRLRTPHDDLEKTHDAREPAGTAGVPIVQAIRTAGLSNVLLVIVRYFGGTKLGKGGLARAYRDAAKGVLAGAPRRLEVTRAAVRLEGPVERDGEVRRLLARRGGRLVRTSYGDDGRAILEAVVPEDEVEALRSSLEAATRGAWRCGPSG